MSANKIFVDTNVLIYAFAIDEPDKRKKIIESLENSRIVVSTQVLKEFANVALKKGYADNKLVKTIIADLSDFAEVVTEDLLLILESIDIREKYKYSFYDSLIIAAALKSRCQTLFSEDMQDGQAIDESLTIKNPFSRN